jgi:penicillin-binding protein 2
MVYLNVDKGLQEFAASVFNKAKGAVVIMEPKTGAVKALVSVPGYDNNLFAHGISSADYQKLLSNKDLPLFNRAIAGQYPPGSTVKPMVALAGLEEGTITDKTTIVDRGVLVIPNQFNPGIAYNFYGWNHGGLGPLDVYSAIARSSDIYFYTVGGGHPDSPNIKNPLGANRLASWYRKFGVGSLLGIDLPGEKTGVVADPAWKENYFKSDAILRKWYLGDTYHISIGQGDMLVTPLQMAEWTSVIANGGVGYKPQLVQKIVDQNGQTVLEPKPEELVHQFGKPENWKIVQTAMRDTVLYGSAKQLLSLPITSAGKTGTSQFDGSDPSRTHAWFTSYAPYEDPKIVVTVLVEAGGEGHAEAEPIAKQILQWWSQNRYNK